MSEELEREAATARNRWERLVNEMVVAGKTRREAIKMLTRRYPKLHVHMLREVNAANPRALRDIDRRFEGECR